MKRGEFSHLCSNEERRMKNRDRNNPLPSPFHILDERYYLT